MNRAYPTLKKRLGLWLVKKARPSIAEGVSLNESGCLQIDLDKLIKPKMKPLHIEVPFAQIVITELGAFVHYSDGCVWCHWRDGMVERLV